MKTKTFGRDTKVWPLTCAFVFSAPYGAAVPMWTPDLPADEDGWAAWSAARLDYEKKRENGCRIDNPSRPFPGDGNYYWEEDKSLRGKNGRKYWDRARYDQGSLDKIWMEEKDQNYLARIEREGKLKELEPAIWYLRAKEHATNIDIKVWWAAKLKLPNLPKILEQAERRMKEGVLGFLEGAHERLGTDSPVKKLPKDVVLQISELAHGKKIPATDFFKKPRVHAEPVTPRSLELYQQCYMGCTLQ